MGYRHYLYAVPKNQVAEIQKCKTNEDWIDFAKLHDYLYDEDDERFPPYRVGKKLYELGKYSGIGFKLESKRPSLFTSEELKERYSDDGFALLTKEDFKAIIEEYRQKIVNWLQSLLNTEDDEERKHLEIEHEIQDKIDS